MACALAGTRRRSRRVSRAAAPGTGTGADRAKARRRGGDVALAQPSRRSAAIAAARRVGRTPARLSDAGAQSRGQYLVVEIAGRGDDALCSRNEGRDRADARAGTEHRIVATGAACARVTATKNTSGALER